MKIYLDKEFMQKFFVVYPKEDKVWEDFEREFLRKVRNFTLYTNFNSLEEMASDEYGLILMELFAEKVKSIEFTIITSKAEWIHQSIINSGGYKFFLLEPQDEKIEYEIKSSGYELITTSNLEKVWTNYLIKEIRKSIDVPVNSEDPDLFNGWQDLNILKTIPTNSIIIVDKYILGDKSNQKICDNLIPLLENIISSNYKGILDVLIVSEDIKSNERNRTIEEKAKIIHQNLINYFSKYKDKIRFKILIHDKSFYPKDSMAIHDRFIYTNYYTIESGTGFNLFNGQNRICANSMIQIHFNYQPFYMGVYPRHLDGLKKYIEKVKRIEVRKDQFKYYPEVECKLLS